MVLPPCPGQHGWVPTSHNFANVITLYLQYLQAAGNPTEAIFINWLVAQHNYSPLTAQAYCYPLRHGHFNLFGRPLQDIQRIQKGGMLGLLTAMPALGVAGHRYHWSQAITCLRDVWLACVIASPPVSTAADLVNQGYAGTANAANAILTVGRSTGRHFDLLDASNNPTPWFEGLFANFYH